MNDINSDSSTDSEPYLTDNESDALDDIDNVIEVGESGVLLNHPLKSDTLSLGRALRAALHGPTRSFTAIVGFLGGRNDNVDERPEDDPVSIIRKELEDGWRDAEFTYGGGDGLETPGFRLGFGSVSSSIPQLALLAWYWLCRWHDSKIGNPSAARKWRDWALGKLEEGGDSPEKIAEILFDTEPDGSEAPYPWQEDEPPELGFGEVGNRLNAEDEREKWETFIDMLNESRSGHAISAEMLAYMLQRAADVRSQPHPNASDDLEDLEGVDKGLMHAKIYVVERDEDGAETVSFVGSNNWSRAAIAAPKDEHTRRNIEVSVGDRREGLIWDEEKNDTRTSGSTADLDTLASQIGRTAQTIFDKLPRFAVWDGSQTDFDARAALNLCDPDHSPLDKELFDGGKKTETTKDTDALACSDEYLELLRGLESVIDSLIDLDLDDDVAELYQTVFANDPSKLEDEFLRKLQKYASDERDLEDLEAGDRPLFGGLKPARYQMDGALRLMGMLQPESPNSESLRGAFLTDEAGLGKTLAAEMTSAYILSEKLYQRIKNVSNEPKAAQLAQEAPLRVSIIVPARLRGEPGDDDSAASGWHAHKERIRQATLWSLARCLAEEDRYSVEELENYFDSLELRVLSHTSLSQDISNDRLEEALEQWNIDPDEFEPEHDLLPREAYNSAFDSDTSHPVPDQDEANPADRLYWVATSELVLIDESHNFRNHSSRATRALRYALSLPIPGEDWNFEVGLSDDEEDSLSEKWAWPDEESYAPVHPRRRVLCLSATPFNNEVDDIITQIAHFDQYQDWSKPFGALQFDLLESEEFEQGHYRTLFGALEWWKRAGVSELAEEMVVEGGEENESISTPREAFDIITRHIYHHLESGRSLRVSEDQRKDREIDQDRDVRDRYSDLGPEYNWVQRESELDREEEGGDNLYLNVFAPAVKWARDQQEGRENELDPEQRNRIDALLSRMMVQRSRARVIKNVKASDRSEGETLEEMFRRPELPRRPLKLNDPNQHREGDEPFEAEVVGQLGDLFRRQQSDEQSEEEALEEGLNLFSYEVGIRREREKIIPEEDEPTGTAANAVGFRLLQLIKRLQSSPYAFMRSIIRGPLRKALLELSHLEALELESVETYTDGIEWRGEIDGDDLDNEWPPRDLTPELEGLLSRAFEGLKELRGFGGALRQLDQERIQPEEATLLNYASIMHDEFESDNADKVGEYGGFFRYEPNSDGERLGDREFQSSVDKLRDAIAELNGEWNEGERRPENSWLIEYLEDLASIDKEGAGASKLWHDVEISIEWLEEGGGDDAESSEGFGGIVDELYADLPDHLRLKPFGKIRAYFAEWLNEPSDDYLEQRLEWFQKRLNRDGRLRALLAWLLLQAAARQEGRRKHADGPSLPDDALEEIFPAGPRTLLFTEYVDTQEYLLACMTALTALFQAPDKLELEGVELADIRTHMVGNDSHEGAIAEVAERLSIENDIDDLDYRSPVGDAVDEWLDDWLQRARESTVEDDDDPLRKAVETLLPCTARVCSDDTSRLDDDIDNVAIVDSDERIEGEEKPNPDEDRSGEGAGEPGDPVDAFSPWYQIEPERGEDSEDHAERLRKATEQPIYTLISTEVLAEGVNLQECGFIAHYDLPWNPTNLIQRNGRIDRRINPEFEEAERRRELAEDLGLDAREAPDFVRPRQVYHSTVVPVEPEFDDRELNRVRETLFRKLNTIRALFGLSSWPVVLDHEAAGDVLDGELEYETPGFRRREDLFNARSRIEARLEELDAVSDDTTERSGYHQIVAEVDEAFVDRLLEDISGLDPDDENDTIEYGGDEENPKKVSWNEARDHWENVLAICVTTWTPYRLESTPVRSATEWGYRIDTNNYGEATTGIVQATLLVHAPDVPAKVKLVTWSNNEVRDPERLFPVSIGLRPGELDEASIELGAEIDMTGTYSSLVCPDVPVGAASKRPSWLPFSPSALSEDVTADVAEMVLSEWETENDSISSSVEVEETSKFEGGKDAEELSRALEQFLPKRVLEHVSSTTGADFDDVCEALKAMTPKLDSIDEDHDAGDEANFRDIPRVLEAGEGLESGQTSNVWFVIRTDD